MEFAPDELKDMVKQAPANATYRSKTIQNQIIDVLGEYIINNIVTEIKKMQFFSVLADEATDISNKEQMALVFRYMNEFNEIKEKFVSFIHCKEGTSGEALSSQIQEAVKTKGLLIIHTMLIHYLCTISLMLLYVCVYCTS